MANIEDECFRERLFVREGVLLNVTTEPTPFPYKRYAEVRDKQVIVNKLLHGAIAGEIWEDIDCSDEMFAILKSICRERGRKNPILFLFVRTDYLLDGDGCTMKQVEINTTSCSFLVYGPRLNRIHSRHTAETLISDSDRSFVDSVMQVRATFERLHARTGTISLLVDENNSASVSNYFEKVEIVEMLHNEGVRMVRVTLGDVAAGATFSDGHMFYEGHVVFLVYYRWFYNASHYTQELIDIRRRVEFSKAVSLPCAELQLVGLKIFQRVFKDVCVLKRVPVSGRNRPDIPPLRRF